MKIQESAENYLETILFYSGESVKCVRLMSSMNFPIPNQVSVLR